MREYMVAPAVIVDSDPAKLVAARQSGIPGPAPHSPEWAPEREPTIKAAIRAEATELIELFRGK